MVPLQGIVALALRSDGRLPHSGMPMLHTSNSLLELPLNPRFCFAGPLAAAKSFSYVNPGSWGFTQDWPTEENWFDPSNTSSARDALVSANGLTYIFWRMAAVSERGQRFFFRHFVASPENVFRYRWHSCILSGTSTWHHQSVWYLGFSHLTLGHLAANCFGLYILLGPDCLGPRLSTGEMITTYLAASGFGSLFQTFYSHHRVLGASAAVMAFFTIQSVIDPLRRFLLLFPIPGMTVTALQLTEGLFLCNAFFFVFNHVFRRGGSVAWLGHLTGMAVGAVWSYYHYSLGDSRFYQGFPVALNSVKHW